MGYKFIDNATDPFVQNHDGDSLLQEGIATWSEGNNTDGLQAIRANDPNTFDSNDRVSMKLLSNDLNLFFNLDRTIYVSKKGVAGGMAHTGGVPKIQHFDTITGAITDELQSWKPLIPNIGTQNFWSSDANSQTVGIQILVGPGSYIHEDIDFFGHASGAIAGNLTGAGHRRFHIHGYGNPVYIGSAADEAPGLNLDYSLVDYVVTSYKPLLLENIIFAKWNTPTGSGLSIPITFKNVCARFSWNPIYFDLENCNKFNGTICFNDAKAVFTGTKFWTLYRETAGKAGVGTYKQGSELQYVGESTE